MRIVKYFSVKLLKFELWKNSRLYFNGCFWQVMVKIILNISEICKIRTNTSSPLPLSPLFPYLKYLQAIAKKSESEQNL